MYKNCESPLSIISLQVLRLSRAKISKIPSIYFIQSKNKALFFKYDLRGLVYDLLDVCSHVQRPPDLLGRVHGSLDVCSRNHGLLDAHGHVQGPLDIQIGMFQLSLNRSVGSDLQSVLFVVGVLVAAIRAVADLTPKTGLKHDGL